jgi:hypothetical protein
MKKYSSDHASRVAPTGHQPTAADGKAVVNEVSETIKFAVNIDGATVNCIASREFFEDRYGADRNPDSWINAYQSNVVQIHDLVVDRHRATGHSLVLLMTEYV